MIIISGLSCALKKSHIIQRRLKDVTKIVWFSAAWISPVTMREVEVFEYDAYFSCFVNLSEMLS